jgi:hypothetical protein
MKLVHERCPTTKVRIVFCQVVVPRSAQFCSLASCFLSEPRRLAFISSWRADSIPATVSIGHIRDAYSLLTKQGSQIFTRSRVLVLPCANREIAPKELETRSMISECWPRVEKLSQVL